MEQKNRRKNRKATISDVARMAGVAPSTVSHTLNGTAPISEETQQRVMQAVEALNYSPNAMARALRQERTRLIGVVLQDISSEFYARCAASILKAAREDRYNVLVGDASFDNQVVEEVVDALIERRVDGLIFIGGGRDEHILKHVMESGVPLVLGDRHYKDVSSVEFDNRSMVRKIVNALYAAGYRRFAYMGEPLYVQNNLIARSEGFTEGMKDCGIPPSDYTLILDKALHQLKVPTAFEMFNKRFAPMAAEERPQVILTSNDMIAQGVLSAALRAGLRVPEDIAVMGYDGISVSEYFQPAITTVRQDEQLLGKSCYQMLKNVIKGSRVTSHDTLPQKLIVRESAVIPPQILQEYGLMD